MTLFSVTTPRGSKQETQMRNFLVSVAIALGSALASVVLVLAFGLPTHAQQTVTPGALQLVDGGSLPTSTSTVGYDASGNSIVQTSDASVFQNVPYHFAYNFNGLLGSGYKAPTLEFNVTAPGAVALQAPAPGETIHLPGLDDATAGQNALADNSGGGCTIALCVASSVSVAQCQ